MGLSLPPLAMHHTETYDVREGLINLKPESAAAVSTATARPPLLAHANSQSGLDFEEIEADAVFDDVHSARLH